MSMRLVDEPNEDEETTTEVEKTESEEKTTQELYEEGLQLAQLLEANEIGDSDWEDVYLADEWVDQG